MKTMTVSEAQAGLPELLRLVTAGEEVELIEQQQPVAKVVPPDWEARRINWSDTWAKVDAIFGGEPVPGIPGSQVVIEGRR